MDRIECNQNVMSELLEYIVGTISEDEGLSQLRLSEFHAKIELDMAVLERLAQMTANLQVLTIRDMNRTSEQVREALAHLAVQIFKHSIGINRLWLSRLGSTEEGEQLLVSMCQSAMTGVRYLNLGDNKSWWTN